MAARKIRGLHELGDALTREDLQHAKRIVIKVGTSILVRDNGLPSMGRIASITEEISNLRSEGREVVFVSSGACEIGRNVLLRQRKADDTSDKGDSPGSTPQKNIGSNTFAAAGQSRLMQVYQAIFQQLEIPIAELLLTYNDFLTADRRDNMRDALEGLLSCGIVPVMNENDAVTANRDNTARDPFTDNDGLSSLVAESINADLLIILTDVEGLYDMPPSNPNARLIPTYAPERNVKYGAKSPAGRGGMNSKIEAALMALRGGVPAVCVCSGNRNDVIRDLMKGKPNIGTLFLRDPSRLLEIESPLGDAKDVLEKYTLSAREESRKLNSLSSGERKKIIKAVAHAIDTHRADILKANAEDMQAAVESNLAPPLLKRLELTESKIDTLVSGIISIAEADEPIGRVLSARKLDKNLDLVKETAPIGVLLVIFESRPDSLPQIAALALSSGNGLLLKGGREAEKSNAMLHQVIVNAVVDASNNAVSSGVIGLVKSRTDVGELLKFEGLIDLVIPRGSNKMVQSIQRSTNIPVLGHADGICHTYVHCDADMDMATKVVIDAKLNYPAACNATETVLIHRALLKDDCAKNFVAKLHEAGIKLHGGPQSTQAGLIRRGAASFRTEYGDERMTLEIVDDIDAAIKHINYYGSHHTECILTSDDNAAAEFIKRVDSACVFHNSSTRFADGYRFGLGAEVGISTGRIHARGPVGVEGLLTQKWVLRPTATDNDKAYATVEQFNTGERTFTHEDITCRTV